MTRIVAFVLVFAAGALAMLAFLVADRVWGPFRVRVKDEPEAMFV